MKCKYMLNIKVVIYLHTSYFTDSIIHNNFKNNLYFSYYYDVYYYSNFILLWYSNFKFNTLNKVKIGKFIYFSNEYWFQ